MCGHRLGLHADAAAASDVPDAFYSVISGPTGTIPVGLMRRWLS
jgi:hypothetical protein